MVARVQALCAAGSRSIIVDAVAHADLIAAGQAAIGSPVSTGASGLGMGLAIAVLRSGAERLDAPDPGFADPVRGGSAILVGSCSAKTLEQVARAEGVMPVLRLDPDRLVASGGDVTKAIGWALDHMPRGPMLIAASTDPDRVAQIQDRYGRQAASHTIETALAEIAKQVVDAGVRRLVVAGGETSGAIVDRLGIASFRVGAEIAPGVPVLRTIGRSGGELAMALKSGNFGGSDFFQDALAAL